MSGKIFLDECLTSKGKFTAWNLLKSHVSNTGKDRRESFQIFFIWSPYVIRIIDTEDHLMCYVIIKGWLRTCNRPVWISWESYHQMSSALSPRNLYSLGYQIMCRSSQGFVLSLGVSRDSKSQFFGVWHHKDWLAVSDEESPSGGAFLTNKISR